MKLAEALIERGDLKRKIAQLETRMEHNAKVQEGDKPAETVETLMVEYESSMDYLEKLIIRINRTNNETLLEKETIAEAITKRDCLKSMLRAYRDLYESGSIIHERYSAKEIRFVRWVDMKELQKKIDHLSKLYRGLDTRIQERNWTVELLP